MELSITYHLLLDSFSSLIQHNCRLSPPLCFIIVSPPTLLFSPYIPLSHANHQDLFFKSFNFSLMIAFFVFLFVWVGWLLSFALRFFPSTWSCKLSFESPTVSILVFKLFTKHFPSQVTVFLCKFYFRLSIKSP